MSNQAGPFRIPLQKWLNNPKILPMKLNQVAFLDDNSDLRELVAEYFEFALQTRVIGLENYQEFLQKLPLVLSSDLVILDIELGYNQPSGYEAYKTLLKNGYHGLTFFLTGHGADHPLVQQAKTSNCIVWEKPITGQTMVLQIKKNMALIQTSGAS
jgi:FixJ family two-component response regulator